MGDEKKVEQVETPAPAEAAVYVVQRLETFEVVIGGDSADVDDGGRAKLVTVKLDAWVDIATVPLPPKSYRKSAIKQALAEAGIVATADMDSLRVRVLDEESARVREVPVVVAEPTFGI